MKADTYSPKLTIDYILGKYPISKGQVIHIGAHQAQEALIYDRYEFDTVLWVEALPGVAAATSKLLGNFPRQHIVQAVCWSTYGIEIPFHVSKGEFSSSALPMKLHRLIWPGSGMTETINLESETVDRLTQGLERISLLNIDVQGAELEVLNGARDALSKTEFLFLEVAVRELYAGQGLLQDINKYLNDSGFGLIEYEINPETGDGSALYGNSVLCGEKLNLIYDSQFPNFQLNRKELIHRWSNYLRFRTKLLVRNAWRRFTGREIVPH